MQASGTLSPKILAPMALYLAFGPACDTPTKNGNPALRLSEHQAALRADWFEEATDALGLRFQHESGATGEKHTPEIMGGGAALFDFDNDGNLDIYLINGNLGLARASVASAPVNRLYRQQAGGTFIDLTGPAGLGDGSYGTGVAIGDVDNDGWLDVYVSNYGADRLYRNTGKGTFEDITAIAGVQVEGWSSSAAFLDYDLDGFLDLYVARYVDFDPRTSIFDRAGRRDYGGPKAFRPIHDILLHNNGDGKFTDVSKKAGISAVRAAGLGVVCEDLNADRLPDIYVANDAYANQLWINQGNGTFRDEALLMGVAVNLNGQEEAGMGVVAADLDGDGYLDLFMTHLAEETNTLYRNQGGSIGWSDASGPSGLGSSSMKYTGFGVAAFDAELDGDLDLAVVNGRANNGSVLPGVGVRPPWDVYAEPNLFYLNDGTGKFTLAGEQAKSFCGSIEVTRGLAVGDIDSDGDLDLLISNVQGKARLYRNNAPRKGHWLGIQCRDHRLNREAIGARVIVSAGGKRMLRTITRGFSYLSSSDSMAHFGLGPASKVDSIEVLWPDGLRERFPGVSGDQAIELARGSGEAVRE